MDGLAFLKSLPPDDPMPMARHFSFRIVSSDYGQVTASATPYLRSIRGETGLMRIRASTLHVGRKVIVAEAKLHDENGTLIALAQSTSLIARAADATRAQSRSNRSE